MDYRYGSHTVYNIAYHFVWVTKYRRWSDDRRDGARIFGASLRARSTRHKPRHNYRYVCAELMRLYYR